MEKATTNGTRLAVLPSSIDIGTTYGGALIEGSFLIFPARHVRSFRTRCFRYDGQKWPPCDSVLDFDGAYTVSRHSGVAWHFCVKPADAGEYMTSIEIECDTGCASQLIKVGVAQGRPAPGDILVSSSPFNFCQSGETADALVRIIGAIRRRTHYINKYELGDDIPHAVLLYGAGLLRVGNEHAEASREILCRAVTKGTNLIILAGHCFAETVTSANRLLRSLGQNGLSYDECDVSLYPAECVSRTCDIVEHAMTRGVQQMYWFRATPLLLNSPKSIQLIRSCSHGRESCLAAAFQYGGWVVALGLPDVGQFCAVGWPYNNDRFIANLLSL